MSYLQYKGQRWSPLQYFGCWHMVQEENVMVGDIAVFDGPYAIIVEITHTIKQQSFGYVGGVFHYLDPSVFTIYRVRPPTLDEIYCC